MFNVPIELVTLDIIPSFLKNVGQLTGAIEYTNCFSTGGKTLPHECSVYDTKQSDGEIPVMLELWGMRSTPSLPSLPGSFWLRVVAPNSVLSMGQIELNCVLMLN